MQPPIRDHVNEELLVELGHGVVDLAINNVKSGGLPFSAIVVNQCGEIVGKGVNQVAKGLECTARGDRVDKRSFTE
jgi:tRNA(Arg) A34 adenosine deaminase TadA